MNGPKYFDNQIVKVQNLEFLRDTQEQNINQNLLALTKGTGGIVTGLNVTSGIGIFYDVSAGVAYDNNGERMQNYSGVSLAAISGSNVVWATMVESDYNPDYTTPPPYSSYPPYNNAQTNINPTNGSGVNVSTFNTMVISQISGVGSIPLGLITSNGANITDIQASGLPYRQNLKLVGILDVNTSTIDGSILSLNSVDSSRFTNPLNYNIFIASGIGIFPVSSGAAYLGTAAIPFTEIDAKQLNVTVISGLSPINVASSFAMATASTIYSTGTNLRINPSGQDTYVGNGSFTGTPGNLFVNKITAWDNTGSPVSPIMNINAGQINLNGSSSGGGAGINISSAGSGTFISGGNEFNVQNINSVNITSNVGQNFSDQSNINLFAPTINLTSSGGASLSLNPASNVSLNAGTLNLAVNNGTLNMGNGTISSLNYNVQNQIIPLLSGTSNIGSAGIPFDTIYTNNLIVNNSSSAKTLLLESYGPDTTNYTFQSSSTGIPNYSGTVTGHGGIINVNALLAVVYRFDQGGNVILKINSSGVAACSLGQNSGVLQTTGGSFNFNYSFKSIAGNTYNMEFLGQGNTVKLNGTARGPAISSFQVLEYL